MTEAEWLSSTDPTAMLDFLEKSGTPSERKLRLFACACCQNAFHNEQEEVMVDLVESFADGLATPEQLLEALRLPIPDPHSGRQYWMAKALRELVWTDDIVVERYGGKVISVVQEVALYAAWASRAFLVDIMAALSGKEWDEIPQSSAPNQMTQTELLRDIFGNPFRTTTIDPSLLKPPIVALVGMIYEGRLFDRLPELANALQQAGCDDVGLLEHLRGPSPHARGCWGLDLVLGKG